MIAGLPDWDPRYVRRLDGGDAIEPAPTPEPPEPKLSLRATLGLIVGLSLLLWFLSWLDACIVLRWIGPFLV